MMSMVRVSTCKHKREYEDADGEENNDDASGDGAGDDL